jgi:protein-serine/threonine kinase
MIQENQIWKIALNLASGLNAIHSLKYVHRDLKPENILVSLEGNFKIADFSSSTNRFYEKVNNHVKKKLLIK